jgi:hypothetical protein
MAFGVGARVGLSAEADSPKRLFSDAEGGEDFSEDFVGGDGAQDLTQAVEGFAQVGGDKLGGGGLHALPSAGEGCLRLGNGADVAAIESERGTGGF